MAHPKADKGGKKKGNAQDKVSEYRHKTVTRLNIPPAGRDILFRCNLR